MDEFLAEVEEYAAACGVSPSVVLRRAAQYGGNVWGAWKAGRGFGPTLRQADRIREFMKKNPPAVSARGSLACGGDNPSRAGEVKDASG